MGKRIRLAACILLLSGLNTAVADELVVQCDPKHGHATIYYFPGNLTPGMHLPASINTWSLLKQSKSEIDAGSVDRQCLSSHGEKIGMHIEATPYNANPDGHCGAADPLISVEIHRDGAILFQSELAKVVEDDCGKVTQFINRIDVPLRSGKPTVEIETLDRVDKAYP